MPANTTKSSDGYYYTTQKEILDEFRKAHRCRPGDEAHVSTPFDGLSGLYCIADTDCMLWGGSGNNVMRCDWVGHATISFSVSRRFPP